MVQDTAFFTWGKTPARRYPGNANEYNRRLPLVGRVSRLSAMPLKVAAGRLDLFATSIVCHLRDGTRTVVCTIARQALRDLGDYHFGRAIPDEAVFSECLCEIERIANTKFRRQKLDENGELSITPIDLIRYGFAPTSHFGIAAE